MTDDVRGHRVLITGAGGGIGRAVALAFARLGAQVVLGDTDDAALAECCREVVARGGATPIAAHCDVTSEQAHRELVDRAVDQLGGLDAAVNNAGIFGPTAAIAKLKPEDWGRVLAVNLTGVFLGMHVQIPALTASGGGAIVNVSSVAGHRAFPGQAAYVASKHGVIGLTKVAALEYATRSIRVNAVLPGIVRTPMVRHVSDSMTAALTSSIPTGRMADPEHIADTIVWLCSPTSAYVNGAEIVVDGGLTAG